MKLSCTLIVIFAFAGKLSAQIPDFTPPSPLIGALLHNDLAGAKKLLAAGANPNEPRFLGFPPVFLPVMHQNLELLRVMAENGADLQARDISGSTALMWAAFNETDDPSLVEELLRLGLDPTVTNTAGETASTWALRRGHLAVVDALENAGASTSARIKDSAQRALTLLQKSGPEFLRVSNCVSCHHQFLPQIAAGVARERGLTIDEAASKAQTEATIAMFKPIQLEMTRNNGRVPDPPVTVSYALLALGAENYPADGTTDAMAQLISNVQSEGGGFRTLGIRPPIESSHFTATALSIRALQLYGKDAREKILRARIWLETVTPNTLEDRAMQLIGLTWANADAESIRQRVNNLLLTQRPDGGWAQLLNLETDAYATGQALVALNWAGVPSTDPAYRRGVVYLLRTQFPDGSWLVRTRTFPFQRYKESGFPHGKDQWISAAGTSWAAMALSLALPTEPEDSKLLQAGTQ